MKSLKAERCVLTCSWHV